VASSQMAIHPRCYGWGNQVFSRKWVENSLVAVWEYRGCHRRMSIINLPDEGVALDLSIKEIICVGSPFVLIKTSPLPDDRMASACPMVAEFRGLMESNLSTLAEVQVPADRCVRGQELS